MIASGTRRRAEPVECWLDTGNGHRYRPADGWTKRGSEIVNEGIGLRQVTRLYTQAFYPRNTRDSYV